MEPLGLYIHIPFCLSKCPYCDFYSLTFTQKQADAYIKALCRALSLAPCRGQPVNSLYFGGGTPVLLGPEGLGPILGAVQQNFPLSLDCEITLEANPAAMTLDHLQQLRRLGFNRVSMGVQAAEESQLLALGRRHSLAQAQESVAMCHRAGFSNISVDLMLGTPGQTLSSIDRFLEIFGNHVQHISAYLLKIEEGTPFAKEHVETLCPGEELSAALYLHTVEVMEQQGFAQYEVSNFARPNRESRHNLKYWNSQEYLGIGPAAHSFLGGRRMFFPRDLTSFSAAQNPWSLWQQESLGGDFFEYAMLRLRLVAGLDYAEAKTRYPGLSLAPLQREAKLLADHSLVRCGETGISLTPQGFLLSNSVIWRLLRSYDE